jgi:cytidylate kinase
VKEERLRGTETLIVTIDGPAGAGKSTAARWLADRLAFEFLDTGALYRAVTYAAVLAEADPADHGGLTQLLTARTMVLDNGHVSIDGKDVSAEIRAPEVTRRVRDYAELEVVRTFLTKRSRELAEGKDIVTEGRDQGTVVFPDAEAKFFVTASVEERAGRRHREFVKHGRNIPFEQVLADQIERDRRDSERDLSPLRKAEDAVEIDTTGLDMNEVVDELERLVRAKMK